MSYLRNAVYLLLLAVASPWLAWGALHRGKYREGWGAKLWGRVPRRGGERPAIWLHAVSVGEVQMLKVLLDRIAAQSPEYECVISTTTKSGYDLACRRYDQHTVFYCPLDFSWSVRAAFERIRPTVLILVELELWPNLIAEAARRGVKIAVVNGRLSLNSYRGYSRLRFAVSPTFAKLDLIAAQNREYAVRFQRLGANPAAIHVTGSLKFDGLQTDRSNAATRQLAALVQLEGNDRVLLAGSTQAPEEQLAIETFNELAGEFPDFRLILVPRHPHRFEEVAELLQRGNLSWLRRSELSRETPVTPWRILLVDTIGELGSWWGTADIAFVGGSFVSRGGQNMMEPAAYGAAVSFGPNTRNFRDVVELLLQHRAARVIADGKQLTQFVRRCLEDCQWSEQLGERAQRAVMEQVGAVERTIELLAPLTDSGGGKSKRSAAA